MYWYETETDGYCEFDTLSKAQHAADYRAGLDREQIAVYEGPQAYPLDDPMYIAGVGNPTHAERCMNPELFGFED